MSTAQDFRLNVLCDVSVPQDSQAGVSCACTFKKYQPGRAEHGALVTVAFPIDVPINLNSSKFVGILDSVHTVKHKIAHIMSSPIIPHSDKL